MILWSLAIVKIGICILLVAGRGKPESPKIIYSVYCHWSDSNTWTCFNLKADLLNLEGD